jgi:hypothetical protein
MVSTPIDSSPLSNAEKDALIASLRVQIEELSNQLRRAAALGGGPT